MKRIALYILIFVSIFLLVQNTLAEKISYIKRPKAIFLTLDMDMNQSMKAKVQTGKVTTWYDPHLFDYLEKNSIPTTFFVSGLFAETYPNLIKSLSTSTLFSFQNHAYDESGFTKHCYWLKTLSTDQEKVDQINKTQNILFDLTGKEPTYFRFPGICHDSHDDKIVKNLGLIIDDGSLNPSDPFNKDTKKMIDTIINNAQDGSVIIMHVGGRNAPKSLDVLRQTISRLKQKGFEFKLLPLI